MLLQISYVIFGFWFFYTFSASKTGEKNKLDIIVSKIVGKNISFSLKCKLCCSLKIHLHHWFYLLIIVTWSIYYQKYENHIPFIGFGGIVQGIYCYDDWYVLLSRKKLSKQKSHH